MRFSEIIEQLLSSVTDGSREDALQSPKNWLNHERSLYVSNVEDFNSSLEKLYEFNNDVASRFSRKTVFEHISKQVPRLKSTDSSEIEDAKNFYHDLLSVKPVNVTVKSPISGIRLDNGLREFSLGDYKFGYMSDLTMPMSNERGMFISVSIDNIYDNNIAIHKAETAFLDFIRLIVFISGKLDKSLFISLGLPLSPDVSPEQMYVSTSSFQITDSDGNLLSGNISNKLVVKVPVNDPFFCQNKDFTKLWELLSRKINNNKMTDMESRLLNSALALGESAFTKDKKNSIIYTCMSLELMFSYDEVGFYQRSIGEKLSDIFTFIVAKDKEARRDTAKLFKKVYRMRSAIVHGGDKELSDENLFINYLMRGAIGEMINNEKYKKIKNISQVYEMLRDAQNSY
ncbi:HEPN domain-containing protein [Vibrio parahaemolyticus]|uniref:HEPN domain-containing protein n=1 Tax=Vibrio parahaemolyticus TaxID=670 RepID=UPI001B8349B5|nr:HEPN domain-containing protein [Vibrio parahaemolyticus]MDF5078214.1 HEPN domain-containing protein [Vibrio parahaemolyticus]MDF5414817.1 HEPN domain-containing protein [Vibrio parahaemolyticus]MDF5425070.1 HEPN domain-containing protein [Vibrio parahaemolyticus]HBC3864228.1 hypothetical protein [Vibrio parahaemolyticus]